MNQTHRNHQNHHGHGRASPRTQNTGKNGNATQPKMNQPHRNQQNHHNGHGKPAPRTQDANWNGNGSPPRRSKWNIPAMLLFLMSILSVTAMVISVYTLNKYRSDTTIRSIAVANTDAIYEAGQLIFVGKAVQQLPADKDANKVRNDQMTMEMAQFANKIQNEVNVISAECHCVLIPSRIIVAGSGVTDYTNRIMQAVGIDEATLNAARKNIAAVVQVPSQTSNTDTSPKRGTTP